MMKNKYLYGLDKETRGMSEMIKTREEVQKRYEKNKDNNLLWYEMNGKCLIPFLPFEYLRSLCKDEYSDEEVREDMIELTRENVIKEMKDYLPFAFDKCIGERGLSANRSMGHYLEWIWLIDDEFYNKIYTEYNENYCEYGYNILKMIEIYLEREE